MSLSQCEKVERFENVNGLRVCAAVGVVAMHVLMNGSYKLSGFLFEELIPSFADFVFLFMMISSFSMCCGYYEKILHCRISPVAFYSKRFLKIWPFFALLNILDVVISPSRDALFEGFANLTLCFGLLPNANISVIGVGWTIGVIFVFYLLFPFFCFLFSNKRSAWLAFGVMLLMNFACSMYFLDEMHVLSGFSERSSILYCAVYFAAGGLVYLYRNELVKVFASRYQLLLLILAAIGGIFYFSVEASTMMRLIIYLSILIYAVCKGEQKGILNNQMTKYVSDISMELYLCHMMIYRVIEKFGFLHLLRSEVMSYCIAVFLTVVGAIVFAIVARWFLNRIIQMIISPKHAD